MIDELIAHHSGKLALNLAGEQGQVDLRERAQSPPQVEVGSRQPSGLEMLASAGRDFGWHPHRLSTRWWNARIPGSSALVIHDRDDAANTRISDKWWSAARTSRIGTVSPNFTPPSR